jgi:hypothetical protein
MGLSSLIERAARIVWQHKSLAALGVLDIVLTGSGLPARVFGGLLLQWLLYLPERSGLWALVVAGMPPPLVTLGQLGELIRLISPYGLSGWIGLIGGAIIGLIAFAVIGIVIEGGIMVAVGEIEQQKSPTIRGVFSSGWRRALPLVVIASIPAIPLTTGAVLVVVIATTLLQSQGGLAALGANPALAQQLIGWILPASLAILFPLGLVTWPLALLGVLAYRACMLDHASWQDSFRRAWGVLRARPGPALLLVAISYAVSILAGTVATLPNQLALIFLPAIVIVWIIDGIARTYYLVLWTLGWRAWTIREGVSAT